MRAVIVDAPGTADDLRIGEVPEPAPGPGEVLLEVAATAVNRADLLQRRGRYPPPPGESEILGLEASGVIRALGPGVGGWAVGDRVMALLAGGGYAEAVTVPAGQLMAVPHGLDLHAAAAIPEAFLTAWSALRTTADLREGERVLVHAAASGVGTAAIGIARALGASIVGTTRSAEKADAIRALGAHALVAPDGTFADAARAAWDGHGADVVLDLVGASLWPETLRALAEGARIAVVGLTGGSRIELDLAAMMGLQATLSVTSLRRRSRGWKAALVSDFEAWAAPLWAEGGLAPCVHATMPLERAADAHRLLEDDATVGKVVLVVRP